MPIRFIDNTIFRGGGRMAVQRVVGASFEWGRGVARWIEGTWRKFIPSKTGKYADSITSEVRRAPGGIVIEVFSTMPPRAVDAIEDGRRPYPDDKSKWPPIAGVSPWAAIVGRNPWAVRANVGKFGTEGIGARAKTRRQVEGLLRTREGRRLEGMLGTALNRGVR